MQAAAGAINGVRTAAATREAIAKAGWPASNLALHALVPEAFAAADRTHGSGVRHTRLLPSPWAAQQCGAKQVFLKLENEQVTGSFKPRGAVNKIMSLSEEELARGVYACSSGNYALGVLHGCAAVQSAGRAAVVPHLFLASNAAPSKVAALNAAGAQVTIHGDDVVEAEREARRAADAAGAVYCSPYNDWQVAGGAGTTGLEILADLPPPEGGLAVFVPVGGGGLISGIAAVMKSVDRSIHVVGCQPAASDVMRASVAAGQILDQASEDTLSDGSAGGVEEGSITFQPCRDLVDDWATVSEPLIAKAMVDIREQHGMVLEGAAGMTVAAALQHLGRHPELCGRTAVVVCCGGNISPERFRDAERLAQSHAQ